VLKIKANLFTLNFFNTEFFIIGFKYQLSRIDNSSLITVSYRIE